VNGAFVLDASAAIAWASPDEEPPAALDAAVTSGLAVAPALWPYEVHNVLVTLARRGRLAGEDWTLAAQAIGLIRIEIETPVRERIEGPVSALAQKHGLTVYDAAYLELARRRALPLATLDEALRKVARSLRVKVV
jgi:predicted nucleic acid-binding protein